MSRCAGTNLHGDCPIRRTCWEYLYAPDSGKRWTPIVIAGNGCDRYRRISLAQFQAETDKGLREFEARKGKVS